MDNISISIDMHELIEDELPMANDGWLQRIMDEGMLYKEHCFYSIVFCCFEELLVAVASSSSSSSQLSSSETRGFW